MRDVGRGLSPNPSKTLLKLIKTVLKLITTLLKPSHELFPAPPGLTQLGGPAVVPFGGGGRLGRVVGRRGERSNT